MRVISIKKIKKFWQHPQYRDSENALRAWYMEVKKASWRGPQEIKSQYKHASIVANNRVVFNVCGNKYRLVVAIKYDFKIVFIRFIGTHKQYDHINVEEV